MNAAGMRRGPVLGERSVFEWKDAWLGRYRTVSIDGNSVAFERCEASGALDPVPTYRLGHPEMERYAESGRIRLLDS